MKYGQLVMGPAGSGKSTYCSTIVKHCESIGRSVHVVNLDPAAENFDYPVSLDIRDLITLEDVMEELNFGPNGGLIYCMEFLIQNLDWLNEELGNYEDDYLLFDLPGQIELYTHFGIMRELVTFLHRNDYRVCGVYLIDSQFMDDPTKYFSGSLSALSAMIQLEIPHVNVLSKMDLAKRAKKKKSDIERHLVLDTNMLAEQSKRFTSDKFYRLNEAICQLLDDYSMVNYIPLNINSTNSVTYLLSTVDYAIQYGEDLEVKEIK
eukprot:Colp12_sorted_trinity150504_noHs@14960